MEQRREPRVSISQPVRLTLLEGLPDRRVSLEATVENASESGLRLLVDQAITLGTAVRLDLENTLILGEIRYCQQAGDRYAVGLHLEHSLNDLASLNNLVSRLVPSGSRERVNS